MPEKEVPVVWPSAYRDATFSKETRDELEGLLRWLEVEYPPSPRHVALRDVIARWDANEATEITLDD